MAHNNPFVQDKEDRLSGPPTAPLITNEQFRDESREQETFRGPEFGEELARSRDLSANFPEQIQQFLAPLLIPQQRRAAASRRNLESFFRRSGGSKSSFAGARAADLERDINLNQSISQAAAAKSFFAPLAALQQNRLAVAGSPLSRSRGSSTSRGTGFGFPPEQGGVTNFGPSRPFGSAAENQAIATGRSGGGGSIGGSGGSFNPATFDADINRLLAGSPELFGSSGGNSAPGFVQSGGGGGGGVFFNPATGGFESRSDVPDTQTRLGGSVAGGFDSTGGFNNDFGINDAEFNF